MCFNCQGKMYRRVTNAPEPPYATGMCGECVQALLAGLLVVDTDAQAIIDKRVEQSVVKNG